MKKNNTLKTKLSSSGPDPVQVNSKCLQCHIKLNLFLRIRRSGPGADSIIASYHHHHQGNFHFHLKLQISLKDNLQNVQDISDVMDQDMDHDQDQDQDKDQYQDK